MFSAAALQGAKDKLKKSEIQERACNVVSQASAQAEEAAIRSVTGLKDEADRVAYYLNGGVDAWFTELTDNCSKSGLSINSLTFPTSEVLLTRDEKMILLRLFKDIFGDLVAVEDASQKARQTVEGAEGGYFALIEEKVDRMRKAITANSDLSALSKRLDDSIQGSHAGSAFVKLTTRSPKDSHWAFCKARASTQSRKASAKENASDQGDVHNALWGDFAENLRLNQRMTSGEDAVLLLATSSRVFEDLNTDVYDNPAGKDQIQLSVRGFDPSITPETEFRGFVWNKQFVCCGQYFHQLYFPRLAENPEMVQSRIATDLRRFYDDVLAPNIPDFLTRCPCFMMDLVWTDAGVLLTEINPFDGEAIGVFPASTGLFSWDDADDRKLMMGERDFQMRVRHEPLITEINLEKHPDLRNLSPLWKAAIYQ